MDKNINIATRDFKTNLVKLINDSQLPAVLLFEILHGVTIEINNELQREIKEAEESAS